MENSEKCAKLRFGGLRDQNNPQQSVFTFGAVGSVGQRLRRDWFNTVNLLGGAS